MRHKKPENWMAAVTRNGHGLQLEDPLIPHERAVEALVMGLRIAEGVDLPRIDTLAGGTAPIESRALARLREQGLVVLDDERLRVTDAGMPVLEAILRELVIA
jgi:oxygen-independent coproporphyrinogen-3 oxidase